MRLQFLTRTEWVFPDLSGSDAPTVLRDLAGRLAALEVVSNADIVYQKLWEREQLGSTGLGSGVAIPHCKLPGLSEVVVAIGICRPGVDFAASDGQKVQLLFLVLSPENAPAEHLQSLAAISKWVKADRHVERILELDSPESIYQLLLEESA